jgi:lycopene cyclase-like protein
MHAGVVVVGDGPAGSALAAACAELGLSTRLVGAEPQRTWPATYGAWIDELAGVEVDLGGPAVWRARFDDPVVAFDGVEPRGIGRAYGLLDNAVLHGALRERLLAAGGRVVSGRVRAVVHDDRGSTVTLPDGEQVRAALVVDATGHRPALIDPGAGSRPAQQVAAGVVADIAGAPVPPGGMAFMDWRTPRGAAPDPPTFLYAMDLGGGRTFVEETSLAARPPLPVGVLRHRLEHRLAAAGATVGTIESREAVAFPMGVVVPPHPQRALAFGAAAGMVHPATGYQVAIALRRAPAVAAAVAEAVAVRHHPDDLASAAWSAVWPDDLLRQRALHDYGLRVLLGFDSSDTQRFFRAFFSLPDRDWRAYLSGAASSRELARIMLSVARRLPPSLVVRVTSGVFGADGVALARAALGGRST